MKAVFVDIETTGLDFDVHVAIDIALIVVDLNDYSEMHEYTSCIKCDADDWWYSDPKALEVNGYNSMNHPKISQDDWIVSEEIEAFLIKHNIVRGKAFFICQNPSFDRPFFLQLICHERTIEMNLPYHWLDLASMYWIKFFGSFHTIPHSDSDYIGCGFDVSLSKDSIAKSLGIPPEQKPHKAIAGARHLFECYKGVTLNYFCWPE